MESFEKLFVNSTNRISAVKNIIVFQSSENSTPIFSSNNNNKFIEPRKSTFLKQCNQQQITQTYEQLNQKYEELSKIVKQANHEKQMMTMLFDKIFKVEQGQEEKLNKRFRRKKNQIQARYECKILNCHKIYSSSTSLARHAKLKHAYSMFDPPQHTYQIPPSPNLNDSSQIQKREETLSHMKSLHDYSKDENDSNSNYQQLSCEANSENQDYQIEKIDPS